MQLSPSIVPYPYDTALTAGGGAHCCGTGHKRTAAARAASGVRREAGAQRGAALVRLHALCGKPFSMRPLK